MTPEHESLDLSPFEQSDRPELVINYRSLREAKDFFRRTCAHHHGLGLFHAPPLSGKMTAIRRFVEHLPADASACIVDGADRDVPTFLLDIAQGFGFELEELSTNVLLNLIKVFAVQQARTGAAPLLVIRNPNRMSPETLHVACHLAQLKVPDQSALRLILVSDAPLDRMLGAREMTAIASRRTGEHALGPMTCAETAYYIDAKLRHAGVEHPQTLLPSTVADRLYDRSGGRPGQVDRLVSERLKRADEQPCLVLTKYGETLATYLLKDPRVVIGRADSNDVVIDHTFVSRHHLMLTRDNNETVLTDLNSTNGTYVNSRRVSVCGLRHDDIIALGDYRLKLFDPLGQPRAAVDDALLADTGTMKTLDDIRRQYARENSRLRDRRS